MKLKKQKIIALLNIATIVSFIGLFLLTQLFTQMTSSQNENIGLYLLGIIVGCSLILGSTVWLRIKVYCNEETIGHAVKRVFCCAVLIGIISVCINVLSGIVSVLLYSGLKKIMMFDQIKSILDIIIIIISIVISPVFVYFGGMGIMSSKSFREILKEVLHIKKKKYFKLFIVILVGYIIGIILFRVFLISADSIWIQIIKLLSFSVLGTGMLYSIDTIIRSQKDI